MARDREGVSERIQEKGKGGLRVGLGLGLGKGLWGRAREMLEHPLPPGERLAETSRAIQSQREHASHPPPLSTAQQPTLDHTTPRGKERTRERARGKDYGDRAREGLGKGLGKRTRERGKEKD